MMKVLKRLKLAIALMGSVFIMAGCGASDIAKNEETIITIEESATSNESDDQGDKIIIEDQLGKTIELDGIPDRVATTIMPFPYIYYAVTGNTDTLVGCNPSSILAYEDSALKYMYPELAEASTEFVDTSFVVNVEEILKLKPDVVFQWNYMEEEIEKMEAVGIKVIALQYGSVEDLETWINIIGKMTGNEERAEWLISYFHENVEEVTEQIATLSEEEQSDILILSDNLKVTGTGFSKYWLDNSGAINPAGDLSGDALNINMEQVYEWNPSIIYIGNFTDLQPSDLIENKLEGQDWSVVDAVQNGKVYKIPIGGYRWDPPGVETPLMIKWLAKIQHPELFEDMDIHEEVKEFYKDVYNFDVTEEILDEILNDTQDFEAH